MKARKVSDILKPKPDDDIMSELLEVEPDKLDVMFSIYKKWGPIFKKEINRPELSSFGDKIRAFKRDLDIEQNKIKDTGYREEGSTGFRGLLRLIDWWESGRYSSDMLEEMINQWMLSVEVALKQFKNMAKREYHPIKEDISNLLKPKSEEEIKKEIRKHSGDDLWDLWKDTGKKEYLKYALKKKITFPIGSEDIAEAIQEFPDAAETLFPLIVQNFPYNLKKEGQKYFLYSDWYDEFADLFMESNELSSDSIQKILSGDSWDLFERYGSENMNLEDEIYSIQRMEKDKGVAYFKSLTEELVTKLLGDFDWLDYDNMMEIKNLKSLTDIAKYLVKYRDERDLEEYAHAFEKALNETQGVADESKAFNELKSALEHELGFKFDKKYYSESDKCYKIPLSKESIIQLFKKATIDDEKINYNAPYYGYNGSIYDHPDVFNDSLSNSISEIDEG